MCCSVALGGAFWRGAEAADEGEAHLGELRAAAAPAAGLGGDDRLAENLVHLLDEVPGALVGHVHLRAAAEIEPNAAMFSSSSILPGPMRPAGSRFIFRVSDGTCRSGPAAGALSHLGRPRRCLRHRPASGAMAGAGARAVEGDGSLMTRERRHADGEAEQCRRTAR